MKTTQGTAENHPGHCKKLHRALQKNHTGHCRKPPRALQKTTQGTAENHPGHCKKPHRALQKTTQGTAENHPGHCKKLHRALQKTTLGTAENHSGHCKKPTQGTAENHTGHCKVPHKVMLVTATMRTFSGHRIWTPPPWLACFRTRMHRCKTAWVKSAKLRGQGIRLRGHRFQSPAGEYPSSPGSTFCAVLLFRYLFRPCVTAVVCKRSSRSAKSAGGQLQLNTYAPYVMWLGMKGHRKLVHGCTVYTEQAPRKKNCFRWHQRQPNSTVTTPLQWI